MSIKNTPQILLITGKTGSGKSEYVESFLRTHVIDPLQEPTLNRKSRWQPPALDTKVEIVVFDHLSNLPDARLQLNAASDWCIEHRKPLWIVLQSKRDFDFMGQSLAYGLEMRISRADNDRDFNFATLHDRDGRPDAEEFDLMYGKEFGFTAERKDNARLIIVPDDTSNNLRSILRSLH